MTRFTRFMFAGIIAFVVMVLAASAFATDLNPGSTVVDISSLFANAKEWLYAVVAFAAIALYGVLQKFPLFNKLVTREQYMKLIDPLLDEAVAFGVGKLTDANWLKIDTKNEALSFALTYALNHGGDILKKFGIDEDALLEKLEAKLTANGWDMQPGKWEDADKA